MGIIKALLYSIIDAFFPNKCIACFEIIPKGESLCCYCHEAMPKTNFDNRCRVCGNLKKQCDCKYRAFHFNGATSPFYNEGIARKAMYAFKFNRKIELADFFAQRMVISVNTDFNGVAFDAVAYVPLLLKDELKRGYNQSRELAANIAKILDMPLLENALGCYEKHHTQHKTKLQERFKNVKGIYYPNISINGRTVLLVDDIKTTGATLDECTKALFKAGADNVYCVTGLITKRKIKRRKGNNGN